MDLRHNPSLSNIFVAIVKDNSDAQRMGRLRVWIPELAGSPDNPGNWYTVSYVSPFAGASPITAVEKDSTDMVGSQTSYGMWVQAPDIGNQVLVCFANGDASKGFWMGCLWQFNMNHMVPGIPAGTDLDGETLPTVEYNKRNVESTTDPRRPKFTPLVDALENQGLTDDGERGISTSGARRDTISNLNGLISKRGHHLVIDDEPDNEFIRMRTRNGAQILIHDSTGYIYLNSRDGNSWVEVSDSAVDVYSRVSVNVRSEGAINMTADKEINIKSGSSINMMAAEGIMMQSDSFGLTTAANTSMTVGGIFGMKVSGDAAFVSEATMSMKGEAVISDANGKLSLKSGGETVMSAGGNSVRTGSQILDNSGGGSADAGLDAEESPLPTEPTRVPAHEPWDGHPKPTSYDNMAADDGSDDLEPEEGAATDDRLSQSAIDAGKGAWLLPTNGIVGSQFGPRRPPKEGASSNHKGVDISRNNGNSVYAVKDGKVTAVGVSGRPGRGYGRRIVLDHGNGLSTLYAHLQSFNVRDGQVVKQGDVIGKVGSTGGSTGPHLHFEIRVNGSQVNPKRFIPELGNVGSKINGGTASKGQ